MARAFFLTLGQRSMEPEKGSFIDYRPLERAPISGSIVVRVQKNFSLGGCASYHTTLHRTGTHGGYYNKESWLVSRCSLRAVNKIW